MSKKNYQDIGISDNLKTSIGNILRLVYAKERNKKFDWIVLNQLNHHYFLRMNLVLKINLCK